MPDSQCIIAFKGIVILNNTRQPVHYNLQGNNDSEQCLTVGVL